MSQFIKDIAKKVYPEEYSSGTQVGFERAIGKVRLTLAALAEADIHYSKSGYHISPQQWNITQNHIKVLLGVS